VSTETDLSIELLLVFLSRKNAILPNLIIVCAVALLSQYA